jgi:ribosome maturation factor RimP
MKSVLLTYLSDMKSHKVNVKVFIEGSSPTQAKTMLSGKITNFDEETIVLDECLIFLDRVISIAPFY